MASKKTFSYKTKLFWVVNVFFWLLVFVFVSIQYSREREYKVELLDTRLQVYNALLITEYQQHHEITNEDVQRLIPDKNVRVTMLDNEGNVLFESHDSRKIANHSDRPEIKGAMKNGHGYTIRRLSQVKGHEFFYSATASNGIIARTALPYNVELVNILSSDMAYIWILLGVTIIINIILYFAISRISLGVKPCTRLPIRRGMATLRTSTQTNLPTTNSARLHCRLSAYTRNYRTVPPNLITVCKKRSTRSKRRCASSINSQATSTTNSRHRFKPSADVSKRCSTTSCLPKPSATCLSRATRTPCVCPTS